MQSGFSPVSVAAVRITVYYLCCVVCVSFTHNSYFGDKINRHVQFPLHSLDMSPFLSNKANSEQKNK